MAEVTTTSSSSDTSRSSSPPVDQQLQQNHEKTDAVNVTSKDIDCEGAAGGHSCDMLESKIDKLLQKQRNELMCELRRLQHGERPVTGQGHKEAVEQFFQRQTGQTEHIDSQQRPENILVEVNALVERRPVSSMLQSVGFRRSLESSLRTALSNVSARNSQTPPRARRNVTNTESNSSVAAPPSIQSSSSVPAPPSIHGLQEFAAARESAASTSFTGRVQHSSIQNVIPETADLQSPLVPLTEHVTATLSENQPHVEAHTQQWVQQIHHHGSQVAGGDINVWGQLEESQRQEFVEEISELVQRQLVTGTLHGNFRNVLERRMRDHLAQSGTDGRRVQEVLQSLPPSTHVRNDFSDLGIVGPGQQQLDVHSDEMSVISATAAVTVPYAQSNAALSRELASLKSQMREMMSMMKIQLDMTMDVQRSVRQEVAAAMSSQQVENNAAAAAVRCTAVNDTTCVICIETPVDTVLYQCGHMCVCHSCGVQLRQRGAHCPVCRAPIRDIIRAYKCNSE